MGSAIEEMKAQIATKEAECRRVQEELEILRRALAILSGRRMDDGNQMYGGSHGIPNMIREALRDEGGPLKADELVSKVKAMGCQATRETILGAAYRLAKDGNGIVLLRRGVFAIPTDEDDMDEEVNEELENAV